MSETVFPLDSAPNPMRLARSWLWAQLQPGARTRGLSLLNILISVLIMTAVTCALLETEPLVAAGHERLFQGLETGFGLIFALEYLARVWTAAELAPMTPWRARLRWMRSPSAIIDLIAFAPALFATGAPTYVLRLLRLARILRLAKLGRFSQAWSHLIEAVASRRYELLLTLMAGVFVLLTSATLLYLAEGAVQPDKFGSIPRALWWSVVTLTTIGYGDVYPLTVLGKALTAATAVVGVGLIATPAGILASAFSDALQRQRAAAAAAHDLDEA